jgi:hypothetical protein
MVNISRSSRMGAGAKAESWGSRDTCFKTLADTGQATRGPDVEAGVMEKEWTGRRGLAGWRIRDVGSGPHDLIRGMCRRVCT